MARPRPKSGQVPPRALKMERYDQRIILSSKWASVESSFLLRQRFTPRQLSKDNRPIFLLLFLMFLHAKDIWRNIHVFQRGKWEGNFTSSYSQSFQAFILNDLQFHLQNEQFYILNFIWAYKMLLPIHICFVKSAHSVQWAHKKVVAQLPFASAML